MIQRMREVLTRAARGIRTRRRSYKGVMQSGRDRRDSGKKIDGARAPESTPGRSTLVEATYGTGAGAPATQLRAQSSAPPHGAAGAGTAAGASEGSAERIHALAAEGTSGAGAPLPHLDLIQRSFGRHDVRGVQAHDGPRAAASAQAMGAEAYATGDHVAFAGAASLHTAAHEAAHVVQQRSGVSLKGGVGAAGDAYERHADAVADTVVAGGSAEALLSTMAGSGSSSGGSGGGGGEAAVQHQSLTGNAGAGNASAGNAGAGPTGAGGASGTPQGAGSAGAGTGLARMQAAIAAQDVPGVVALQAQLLPQQATDSDAQAAIVAARRWAMERIAAIRDTYAERLAAARTGTPDDASHNLAGTNAVETLETAMDTECTPYLDALMHGDPRARYTYDGTDTAITGKVFEAVRLHAMRRGVAQIGHRDAAETEARREGGVAEGSWCGAFAYTQGQEAGGMDSYWSENMAGTPGIMAALAYGHMATLYLWVDGAWVGLRDYHDRRGSLRHYQTVQRAAPAMGIQAGDLALIDNAKGTQPDHIATVIAFDGRYVTLVGGNQGSESRTDESGVSRSDHGFDLQQNPTPFDARATDPTTHNRIDAPDPALAATKRAHTRIHGFGRWSVVDYERHIYRRSPRPPTTPPTAAELSR
jgi:hypothetical protein